MILAILRAQWLSMRAFRLSAKPASAIFSMVTSLLFYGFWVIAAYAAQVFLADPANRARFRQPAQALAQQYDLPRNLNATLAVFDKLAK